MTEGPDEFTGPPAEESRSVTVVWKHDSEKKQNAAFVAELKDQDILSDTPKTVQIIITRSMLGIEVRDRIREALELHESGGQLLQLTLHEEEKDFPTLVAG